MSILIKGLKMPNDGEFLDLVITADGIVRAYDQENEKIAEAVELPDHGDLIDRDKQIERAWRLKLDARGLITKLLNTATVIVPAERNNNGET